MKALFAIAIAAGALSFAPGASAQNQTAPDGCAGCARNAGVEAIAARPVPGTNETVLVGRIENLIPIAVLTSLGCEKCAAEATAWALQQGSSTGDVSRALRAVAQMQTLDCFKQQFGPGAAARPEKPLAAARKVLPESADRQGIKVTSMGPSRHK